MQFLCWLCTCTLLSFIVGIIASNRNASITLNCAGCTLPQRLFQDSFFAYRFVNPNVSIQYLDLTTHSALCRLKSYSKYCKSNDLEEPHELDFIGTASVLPPMEYKNVPDLQMYPVAAAAVVPVYNLGEVSDLVLTPQVLAQIFSGQITHWDDWQIQQDNPSFSSWKIPPNQTIEVVVRAEACGTTEIFKKSLASFDDGFRQLIDISAEPTWGRVKVSPQSTSAGLNAYMMVTPFTIGFSVLGDALDNDLNLVKLQVEDRVIVASSSRIEFSAMELGALFGNNGDDPKHLTADIQNAEGVNTWPICGYVYVVLRKTTLREGATCQHMAEMVAFWKWFWNADIVHHLIRKHRMGVLPEIVRQAALERMVADVTCNSVLVDKQKKKALVTGVGPQPVMTLFDKLSDVYNMAEPSVNVSYTVKEDFNELTILDDEMFVVLPSHVVGRANEVSMAFAAFGIVMITTLQVTLDRKTIQGIMEGRITTWMHEEILAINPNGIINAQGVPLTDKSQPIILLAGPCGPTDALETYLRTSDPFFSATALVNHTYPTEEILQTAVIGTPYSLAVATLAGSFSPLLTMASYRRDDGSVVHPSRQAIQSCASKEAYDAVTKEFFFHRSPVSTCYPLVQPTYVNVRKSQCDLVSDERRTQTIAFLEWLFDNADSAIEDENLVLLDDLFPEVDEAVNAALQTISCTPRVQVADHTLLMCIVLGAGSVLLLLCGLFFFYIWRSTARMRAMRKQFSNDNVAHECAAAIARFDLDAVAWLKDLSHPNNIQQSFIQIVQLLTDVKPFIPDQLLISLGGAEEEEPKELPRQGTNMGSYDEVSPRTASASKRTSLMGLSSHASSSFIPAKKTPKGTLYSRAIQKDNGPGWNRKRCTFLVVKLQLDGCIDDPVALDDLGQVTISLVAIGKQHGAIIDKVSSDFITFHWGVQCMSSKGSLQAVLAAMDMAHTMNAFSQTLSTDFQVSISVGHGVCHFATLSSSGHCFFILAGAEVNLPMDVVQSEIGFRLKCPILITQAMYQEVQYSMVRCFPRVWFKDVLLWEPVHVHGEGENEDEWMYELRRMEDKDKQGYSGQVLYPVFEMAHEGKSIDEVAAAIANVKTQYMHVMSQQDLTSLEYLLDVARQQALLMRPQSIC